MRNTLNRSFNKPSAPTNEEMRNFVTAASNGDNAAVNAFLDKYPDAIDNLKPDTTYIQRETALIDAAGNGRKDIVELLIKRGATVDFVNQAGWTALARAAAGGQAEIVDALLKHGASINGVAENSLSGFFTPLRNAIRAFQPEMVKLLLDRGASLESGKREYGTALDTLQGSVNELDINVPIWKKKSKEYYLEKARQIETILKQKTIAPKKNFNAPKAI
jgi:ankyrin repeat protein